MKNIFTIIILGTIAFINAQGITMTLGGNTSSDKFIVENSDSEAGLIVTGEGKVGVGTNNPTYDLDIINQTGEAYIRIRSDGASSSLIIDKYSVSHLAQIVYQHNHVSKFYTGLLGNNNYRISTDRFFLNGLEVQEDGNINISDDLYVSGNVGIGTTNPLSKLSVGGDGNNDATIYGETSASTGRGVYGYATGSAGFGVFGHAPELYGKGVVGHGNFYDFYATGPGTDYGAASSIRWKTNIVEISNPLEKLTKLRGVYFDWDEEHGGQHDVGCIAEEVGKVLPEIVVYEENGVDANGMDYSKLTPLLIEVAKAQQKLIEDLTERINFLESK